MNLEERGQRVGAGTDLSTCAVWQWLGIRMGMAASRDRQTRGHVGVTVLEDLYN